MKAGEEMEKIKEKLKIIKLRGIKFNSIKSKMIAYFLVLLLFATSILGFLPLRNAVKALTNQADQSLEMSAHQAARLVESRLGGHQDVLEVLANRADMKSMNWRTQQPLLEMLINETSFLDFGVVDLDGIITFRDGSTLDISEKEYFKDALNGEATVSDLSLHSLTGEPEVRYLSPIMRGKTVVGVLIGVRDGFNLSELVNGIGYGEEGYAYIVDKDGKIIAHRDISLVESQVNIIELAKEDKKYTSSAQATEEVINSEEGATKYKLDGDETYIGYSKIPSTDWSIIVTAEKDEVLNAIPGMRNSITVSSLIINIFCIIMVAIVSSTIAKPIVKVKNHSEKLAMLDISEDVDSKLLAQNDEIGTLANSIQSIIINFRDIINEINQSSSGVASSSEELTATSQQSSSALEQVALAIDEVANGAADQAENTEIGSNKAADLGEIMESDQVEMKGVNESTSRASKAVEDGLLEIEKLSESCSHS